MRATPHPHLPTFLATVTCRILSRVCDSGEIQVNIYPRRLVIPEDAQVRIHLLRYRQAQQMAGISSK